jgi:mono/diheme cytochrome c family protein
MRTGSSILRVSVGCIVLFSVVAALVTGCSGLCGSAKQTSNDPPAATTPDPPAKGSDPPATTTDPPSDPSSLSASAQAGKALFSSSGCMGCHTVNGQGGKVGPNLSNEGNSGHSSQWLATQIRNPRKHNSQTIMPPYNSLTDQKVNNLVTYLESLKTGSTKNDSHTQTTTVKTPKSPKTPAASSSSASIASGGELWGKTCGQCHNLRPPSEYNDAQWAVAVHHMRVRAPLTGEQQKKILAFLQASN